jgi:hypothetical protein
MDQRLGNMEQSMKSLSDSHDEFRKSQQTMQDRMKEIYEMLAKTSNGENSRGRNHKYEGENSFKFFWNEDEQAKIEKMQSEFIVWKEKFNKKMEEHMRKIESFYTPSPAPASQSLPITPTPQAATVKRKKIIVEATKIHPCQHCTKPPSISRRSKHYWSEQRRLSSTTLAMLDRNLRHRSSTVIKPHRQIAPSHHRSFVRQPSPRTSHCNRQFKTHRTKRRHQPCLVGYLFCYTDAKETSKGIFVWLKQRKKKGGTNKTSSAFMKGIVSQWVNFLLWPKGGAYACTVFNIFY